MKYLLRIEYLLLSLLIVSIYLSLSYAWYWLIVLFLVFDVSAIGYLINKKIGAALYNVVHSVTGPVLLLLAYIVFDIDDTFLFIDLLWFFHIAIDRTFGFGLKHYKGFEHTHLGTIGRAKK